MSDPIPVSFIGLQSEPIEVESASPDQTPVGVLGSVVRGPAGLNFQPQATGPFSARSDYDAETPGFAFLATDTGFLYFREGLASGGWSTGVAFSGSAAYNQELASLTDVDVTQKVDTSVLYYKSSVSKFVADDINTIVTLTDGGNF